jgi:hypothetical protein
VAATWARTSSRPRSPEALPARELGSVEARTEGACRHQRAQEIGRDRGVRGATAGVERALERDVGVDAPFEDAGAVEVEEAGHQHLAGRVDALVEGAQAAPGLDQAAVAIGDPGALDQAPVSIVLQVPLAQQLGDRVAERADPELQRAAVAHQDAGV